MQTNEILAALRAHADPMNVEGMARYGISSVGTLGVSMPVIRAIARQSGRNSQVADELWASGIHEARILATLVADPKQITRRQMTAWARDFDSWDVCDQDLPQSVPLFALRLGNRGQMGVGTARIRPPCSLRDDGWTRGQGQASLRCAIRRPVAPHPGGIHRRSQHGKESRELVPSLDRQTQREPAPRRHRGSGAHPNHRFPCRALDRQRRAPRTPRPSKVGRTPSSRSPRSISFAVTVRRGRRPRTSGSALHF